MKQAGFIGYGNMAAAIAGGAVRGGQLLPGQIHVYDPSPLQCQKAKEAGFTPEAGIPALVRGAEVVFLAVKPNTFPAVLAEIAGQPVAGKVFVSIAAGVTIAAIERQVGEGAAIIRTMPNTPLMLGCGTTALCRNGNVSDAMFAFVKNIFASSGTVYELPETELDHVINLSGSAPAYIYLFAHTLAKETAAAGHIPYDTALAMVCDTLHGAAAMLQKSGQTPEELICAVSSPGGATIAAFAAFEEAGFTHALAAGMKAAVQRAEEMGEKL